MKSYRASIVIALAANLVFAGLLWRGSGSAPHKHRTQPADLPPKPRAVAVASKTPDESPPTVGSSRDQQFMDEISDFLSKRTMMHRKRYADALIHADERYQPLFLVLKLTPEQFARFKQLLLDENMVEDATTAVLLNNRSLTLAERARLVTICDETLEAKIRTLLGKENAEYYTAYRAQSGNFTLFAKVYTEASFTDHPISRSDYQRICESLASTTTDEQFFAVAMQGLDPTQATLLANALDTENAESEMAEIRRNYVLNSHR